MVQSVTGNRHSSEIYQDHVRNLQSWRGEQITGITGSENFSKNKKGC